ncbi:MAG: putative protein serine/threonine kinase, partial [Tremellales sp. Tagirdzhanova-0007]
GTVRNALPTQPSTVSRAATRPLPSPSIADSSLTPSTTLSSAHNQSVNGRALPSVPGSNPFKGQQKSVAAEPSKETVRNSMPSGPPSEVQESDEIAMLEGVIIPAINSLTTRIPNDHARLALVRLRQAFEEAEREIPGVTSAFVLEIVENVEPVEEN